MRVGTGAGEELAGVEGRGGGSFFASSSFLSWKTEAGRREATEEDWLVAFFSQTASPSSFWS